MDALINTSESPEEAPLHRLPREQHQPCSTAGSPQECTAGVSLDSILTPGAELPADHCWYVLRVSYSREREARDRLLAQGILAYVPTRRRRKEQHGRRVKVEQSLLSNLLFVFTTPAEVARLVASPLRPLPGARSGKPAIPLHYLYDHTVREGNGTDRRVVIGRAEMANFIRFTHTGSEVVRTVSEEDFTIRQDEEVEVTEGDFKGVRGRVVRINRQTCIMVDLRPVCMVASAYIPKGWLRKVSGEEPQDAAPKNTPQSAAVKSKDAPHKLKPHQGRPPATQPAGKMKGQEPPAANS